jgi:hypothetical protein
MAIPGSGAISMSMFNTELGRASNTANSSLAGGTTPAVGSLFWLGGQSGSLNQTSPHAMSEWYGYVAGTVVYFIICDYLQADGSGNVTVGVTASETVSINVNFDWTWTGDSLSIITGTTTISSGNISGSATVGGAFSNEYNTDLSIGNPYPSSYGTQVFSNSYSYCY